MHHPHYPPQELRTTLKEVATLALVAVDHTRNRTPGPLPEAQFTHPQTAANITAHLVAFFAMHSFTDWEALEEWFTDLETKGLDRMTNNPQPLT